MEPMKYFITIRWTNGVSDGFTASHYIMNDTEIIYIEYYSGETVTIDLNEKGRNIETIVIK